MEEEKIDAIAAKFFSSTWEQFCLLSAFGDTSAALQWWQTTNNAYSGFPWWHKVAAGMAKNLAQLAEDIRREKKLSADYPPGATIFKDAQIGQMSAVSEKGSKQIYISNQKHED